MNNLTSYILTWLNYIGKRSYQIEYLIDKYSERYSESRGDALIIEKNEKNMNAMENTWVLKKKNSHLISQVTHPGSCPSILGL
jgi:hypothetical protein